MIPMSTLSRLLWRPASSLGLSRAGWDGLKSHPHLPPSGGRYRLGRGRPTVRRRSERSPCANGSARRYPDSIHIGLFSRRHA